MSTAALIAEALAGHKVVGRNGNFVVSCPAHRDSSPSLSLRDGDRGLMVHCFAGCAPADVYHAIRRRGHKLDPGDTAPQPVKGSGEYQRRQAEKAEWLWSRRRSLAGTLADRYLREHRGYTGPLPTTLSFLPPYRREHRPAMIAAVTEKVDEPNPGILGKPRDVSCVHLTLLNDDGTKLKATREQPNKLLIGSPYIRNDEGDIIGSRPIVLAPPNDLMAMSVCEGVEDALTAHAAIGLGAWAAGAAGFMPKLADVVPSYIEALTIFAHADKAGQDGARSLAAALRKRGMEVRIDGL